MGEVVALTHRRRGGGAEGDGRGRRRAAAAAAGPAGRGGGLETTEGKVSSELLLLQGQCPV